MAIENSTVPVTGANRGIDRALVDDALRRGARVYAGTRQEYDHPDSRVTPLRLDVTDSSKIRSAAERVEQLDVLLNNAGFGLFDDLGSREILAVPCHCCRPERDRDLRGERSFVLTSTRSRQAAERSWASSRSGLWPLPGRPRERVPPTCPRSLPADGRPLPVRD